MKNQNLREFLRWLITPQNNEERIRFKRFVDEYIETEGRIDEMTEIELTNKINEYLSVFNLKIEVSG